MVFDPFVPDELVEGEVAVPESDAGGPDGVVEPGAALGGARRRGALRDVAHDLGSGDDAAVGRTRERC